MKKILVLGAFGYVRNQLDGQTIKTRSVYELVKNRSSNIVDFFDTLDAHGHAFKMLQCIKLIIRSNILIILPASNSFTYLLPISYYLSKIFHFRIILICIGGWQVEYFEGIERFNKSHKFQLKLCKKINVFLPELHKVESDLKNIYNFKNIEYFPNFRQFDNSMLSINQSDTLRLVFMARINKLKGYDIVFYFAKYAHLHNLNISIDFYGQINPEDEMDFTSKISTHSNTKYKGYLKPEEIQNTLHQYDVLLFPTRYYTEGIPGTVIDAYIAGIPVVATEWKHSHEIIKDNMSGFIVPFNFPQEVFNQKILMLYNDRTLLYTMKSNAMKESQLYSEDNAWQILSKYL